MTTSPGRSNKQHATPSEAAILASVDVATASRESGIPYSTLRMWIADGRLKAYRLVASGRPRILISDLNALLVPIHADD